MTIPSLLLFWCVFLTCKIIDANQNLFLCPDDVYNWEVSVSDQTELDNFMERATSPDEQNTDRCIRLSLTGDFHYRLDIVKLMQIKLGTAGGLIVVGMDSPVEIDCIPNVCDKKRSLKPISNNSIVVFDGLTFINCPVPIMIEEVSSVVVQNCNFT